MVLTHCHVSHIFPNTWSYSTWRNHGHNTWLIPTVNTWSNPRLEARDCVHGYMATPHAPPGSLPPWVCYMTSIVVWLIPSNFMPFLKLPLHYSNYSPPSGSVHFSCHCHVTISIFPEPVFVYSNICVIPFHGPGSFQQLSLSNPRLEARDCVRMVAAIGNVLSTMPLQDLSAPLGVLMTSRVKSLEMLAHQNPSNAVKPLVEKELLIVSAFCHHIYPTLLDGEQHPVSVLFCVCCVQCVCVWYVCVVVCVVCVWLSVCVCVLCVWCVVCVMCVECCVCVCMCACICGVCVWCVFVWCVWCVCVCV